jgi:hypothetical protein
VVALRSFHFAMWMLHLPSQQSHLQNSSLPISVKPHYYILALVVSASSLTLPQVIQPWRRTHLPFQSLTCPRKVKSLLLWPSFKRSLLEHRCEVGTTSVLACLLADTVSLCSPIACPTQARTESRRARGSWTLHRLGGVLERAVSASTGGMRQTSYHQL